MSDPTTMIGKVGFEPTSSLSSFAQFHMNPKTLLRPSLKVANLLSQPVWIVIIMFPRGLLSLPSAIKGLALDHSATYPLVMWCHLTSDPTTKPPASFDLATLGSKVRCSSDWAKGAKIECVYRHHVYFTCKTLPFLNGIGRNTPNPLGSKKNVKKVFVGWLLLYDVSNLVSFNVWPNDDDSPTWIRTRNYATPEFLQRITLTSMLNVTLFTN